MYSGLPFEEATILDWGCGCARVMRHMPVNVRPRVYGADVDRVNIEWDKANISFGHFDQLYPSTPFPYADNSFDLIFGTSVITHLDEAEQFFWLSELNRISRGYVLLSVHGLRSCAKSSWGHDIQALTNWLGRGYVNAEEALSDIADVVGDRYYRSTAHTWDYIFRKWKDYIHVVEVCGGGINDHDVAVCKKMSPHLENHRK